MTDIFSKSSAQESKLVVSEESDTTFDPFSGWLLLLYGLSGAGKTWFGGSAQDAFYLNTGGGVDTLTSPLFLKRYPNIRRKIEHIYDKKEISGFELFVEKIKSVLNNEEIRKNTKTIVVDDATSLRSLAVNDANIKKGLDTTNFIDVDGMDKARFEMGRLDWFMERYGPIFRAERINFLMLAHEARIYGNATAKGKERPLLEVRPAFTGEKHVDWPTRHFDEVWYLKKEYNERASIAEFSQIKTGGAGIEIVKSRRAGVFARYEIGKDFEQLLKQRQENKLHSSYQTR